MLSVRRQAAPGLELVPDEMRTVSDAGKELGLAGNVRWSAVARGVTAGGERLRARSTVGTLVCARSCSACPGRPEQQRCTAISKRARNGIEETEKTGACEAKPTIF